MSAPVTLSERDFQNNVIDLAKILGWRVAHFRPARHSKGWSTPMQGDKGFPDLVLAKDGLVIFAELKSEKGKVTHDQAAWLTALSEGDIESWKSPLVGTVVGNVRVAVWRPDDLEEIKDVLTNAR